MMELCLTLGKRNSFAFYGTGNNHCRFAFGFIRFIERIDNLCNVVTIDFENMPAKGPPFICMGIGIISFRNRPHCLDAVFIENPNEIVEFMIRAGHRCFPYLTFRNFAVTHNAVNLIIFLVEFSRHSNTAGDAETLAEMASKLEIRFEGDRVLVDGRDMADVIRTEPVSRAASQVAALTPVREAILDLQRSMRRPPGLVADGRDMGTVVVADAPLKIFLDASARIRAERRYNQLKNKGLDVNFRALLANLEERDARDRERAVSPLVPAPDALIIDSTDLTIEEVLERVLSEVESRHLN